MPDGRGFMRETLAPGGIVYRVTPDGQTFAGRPLTNWKLEDFSAALQSGLENRSFAVGRRLFAAAACFACHRVSNEGGLIGPDLTSAGARYSARDLLAKVLNPSSQINEQFVPTVITRNNGETVTGIIVNLGNDNVTINTDLSDPMQKVGVDRKQIRSIEPSKVSPMPPMLLAALREPEILDLVAYVLSGGDPQHSMFSQ
jgi:putative heme-binding domain-containing protein